MRGSLNWNDAVTAAAQAVLAERPATPARPAADASFRWNAYEVWLSRVKAPLDLTPRPSPGKQATPPPQGTTLRD